MTANASDLISVDQVARELGLHVRTVRAYLRMGRLKGIRIGKQYRIRREDLDSLVGRAPSFEEPVRRQRHTDVSAIVQVDAISPESVDRVTNMLMAAARTSRSEDHALRVDVSYDRERARLKVFVSGSIETSISMLNLVKRLTEAETV